MTWALTTPAPKGPLLKDTLPSLPGIPITPAAVQETAAIIRAQAHRSDLAIFYLGRQPYRPVWELQRQLHAWRVAGKIPDVVLLLEHQPVYTLGKHADARNLLTSRPADAEVVATDRGGDVTYHGPGQLVGYPIIDLRDHRPSVTWYVRGLEEVIIRTLAAFGLTAARIAGLPGVWVGRRKVAALHVCGLHLRLVRTAGLARARALLNKDAASRLGQTRAPFPTAIARSTVRTCDRS